MVQPLRWAHFNGFFCWPLSKALIGYAIARGVRFRELEPSEGVEPPSSTHQVDALPLSYVGEDG
jgi:hypothetical protein